MLAFSHLFSAETSTVGYQRYFDHHQETYLGHHIVFLGISVAVNQFSRVNPIFVFLTPLHEAVLILYSYCDWSVVLGTLG